MCVYRPWTDVLKAVEGIPSPETDVNDIIVKMRGLCNGYRLNRDEMTRLMYSLTTEWATVRRNWKPRGNNSHTSTMGQG